MILPQGGTSRSCGRISPDRYRDCANLLSIGNSYKPENDFVKKLSNLDIVKNRNMRYIIS